MYKVAEGQPVAQLIGELYETEHTLCGDVCICCGYEWGDWNDETFTVLSISSGVDGQIHRLRYTPDDGLTSLSFSF